MEPQIDSEQLNEILQIHIESYINNFEAWKLCVVETNLLISIEYDLRYDYFTYDSFCKEFNESIIEYLTVSDEMPTIERNPESIVHEILMQRVERKLKSDKDRFQK